LLAANTIAQFGNSFSLLAIPWFVLETTGSASQTGITAATGVIPLVIVGFLGGAVVDRIGYRSASIISDLLSFFPALLIPVLHATVGLAFWQLLVLVFLGSFFDGPGMSARQALLPDLAQMAEMSPDRSNTAFALTRRIAGLLGPPAAGLILAATGPATLLYFNAATFALSAGVLALTVPPLDGKKPAASDPAARTSYLDDLKEGFQFVIGNRLLLLVVLASSLGSLVAEPFYSVLLPIYANQVLESPSRLGFIYAALAAGSILGNLLYIKIVNRVSRSAIMLSGFAIRGLAFTVMLMMPEWWVVAIAMFVGAVALEPVNPMSITMLQEIVPDGMLARVLGLASAMNLLTMPVGMMSYGFLVTSHGLERALQIFVALNLALPVLMVCMPTLRHLPEAPPDAAAQPVA
jgi:MFS family permease